MEFGELEILMIDEKPYFPATECAKILSYTNPQKAIRDHCKGVNETFTPSAGGLQKKKYIPEGDLYRLIIRSKLPAAERFERWVFDEVLPCIRRYGAYVTNAVMEEAARNQEYAGELLRLLRAEKSKSAALEPKARYCDQVIMSDGVVPVSVIAKDYGMTATQFNKLLNRLGVQFKVGGSWLLYKRYSCKGYTRTRTYYTPGGMGVIHTCWTQKGRQFLYDLLCVCGISPLMEGRHGQMMFY
jgi:prophage antirepressor-like protein